jgi:tetratricopeptide (TPR) repeat protein
MIGQQPPLKVSIGAGRWDQRWRVAGICVVLAAITFAVFGQTLRHEFIDFDDGDYVYDNPMVARGLTLKGIVWAFTHFHSANWHPLTWLSHMLDCQFYGLNPAGHHLTNVLLHTATVIALFLVLRQMTGALWRSAFVAAVFAIHPLRVESVAWVAERKDVLSGLFFMLTIGAYVRYARRPRSPACYGLLLLLFAMGLMCKPMLVTLPVVLLLLDYWPLQRVEPGKLSGLVMEKLPLLALSAASCVATVLAQNKAIQSTESYSLPLRFANALVACMIYLGQMVWPTGLAAFYPHPHNGLSAWEVGLAGTLLAGFSAVALRQRRKQPWLLAGWLWYLMMLLPVVGLIQVGGQAHADRYTYLPQIGIYMAVTWQMAEWGASRQACRVAIGGLMAGVLAVLMLCAWKQTAYWKNSETLWNHALGCTTGNYVAHLNLGADLLKKGRVDDAIAFYQKGLQTEPDNAESHNNLANALREKGRVDEAITQYKKALELKPDYAEAQYNLGTTLLQKGNADEAITHYQAALLINPDYAEAHYGLGNALRQKGRVDDAMVHYQKALDIRPDYAEAHYSFGNAFREKGNVNEAISQYQEALETKPDYTAAHVGLGIALLQAGKVDEAIVHCEKALEIKPDDADAHYNLGDALLQKGRMDEAITHFQRALQKNPDYVDAHVNLGNVLLQKGNVDEAISHFQKALLINPNNAKAQNNLGNAFLQKGIVGEAIAHFQKSLQIEPTDPSVQNNLAWLLATCSEASLRNGGKAVELAQQANTLTGGANPIILHTLAAAFAEAGRFPEAVETAQRALRLAEAQSNTRLAGALQSEMKLYQAGSPFHSPQQTH